MSKTSIERLPPHNLSAERAVLGSMLRDRDCVADVLALLSLGDFYWDAHQKVFAVLAGLFAAGKPLDLVVVAEALTERNQLEEIGRAGYLAELFDSAPTAANAIYYARLVRDKALLRSLIRAASETLRAAYEPTGPAQEVVAEAERRLLDIGRLGAGGQTIELPSAIAATFARLDARMRGCEPEALPTGFVDLDRLLVGLFPGKLYLIGARPSQGKTALGLAIARNVFLSQKASLLFVSLEQSQRELSERLLCMEAKVDSQNILKAALSGEEMDRLTAAGQKYAAANGACIHIDDCPQQRVARIAANGRRLVSQKAVRLLVIDYLQLIAPDNSRASRVEQVEAISHGLKGLARDLDVPLVALAQLNREVEGRPSQPRLADLKNSGALEQDADVVLLMHKESTGGDVDTVGVEVAKQRDGPTGSITLAFRKQYVLFENYAPEVPFAVRG